MAIPMSEKSWPASSFTKSRGRKTSTVVIVPESTAVQTDLTPSRAASRRVLPFCRSISMLSRTTMVLSIVMPMAKAIPASEITLMVRSRRSSPMKPATTQTGIPDIPIRVAEPERRKRNITKAARTAPIRMFCTTLRIELST